MSWALYPSLEDMKVDQYLKSQDSQLQTDVELRMNSSLNALGLIPSAPPLTLPRHLESPSHMIELKENIQLKDLNSSKINSEYMGLELFNSNDSQNQENFKVLAPLSNHSLGYQRSAMTGAIREIVLCKDEKGKVGLRLRSVNKGIFVLIVAPQSPASLAGIKFGDQIVQVDSLNVAGMESDKVEKIITKARHDVIHMIVRDRPFERTLTMHKDSNGYIGFVFKHGRINSIVKDSSAARNGLLIDHYLLEVNGKNVVGLKDSDIKETIDKGGNSINLTIMPAYIFEHMIKNLSLYNVRKSMDRALSGINDI